MISVRRPGGLCNESGSSIRRFRAAGFFALAMLAAQWLYPDGHAHAAPSMQGQGPLVSAPSDAGPVALRNSRRSASRIWESDDRPAGMVNPDSPRLSDDPDLIETGRRLYHEGRRASGEALVGVRLDGKIRISGEAAACVLCHRRSGLGSVEGIERISPISGRYLFDQDRRALLNQSIRGGRSMNAQHEPYSLEALEKAIRNGKHISGREIAPLMPRYEVSDTEVLALASYLRRVSNAWSPGVSESTIRLATVIAPDVDPQKRRIFLQTLRAVVAQKNGNVTPGQRTMSSAASLVLQTDRHWDLQVWELTGEPSTWSAQLAKFQSDSPVFAVLSGLGSGSWWPVHDFCESQRVPCWFPSVAAVPPEGESDFYSVYFSRGVALEADVLVQRLQSDPASNPRGRILQVFADEGIARTAVRTLEQQFGDRIESFRLPASGVQAQDGRRELMQRLSRLRPSDTAIFWLAPAQLKPFEGMPVPAAKLVFSGAMGVADSSALTANWRAAAQFVYPYQLPHLRKRGLTYFNEFMKVRGIAVEDEVLQSEVFFAASFLNDVLVDMLDNLHRDFLMERAENMLSLRELTKAEDEMRELSTARAHLVGTNATPNRLIGQRAYVPRAVPRSMTATEMMPAMSLATASPQGVGALAQPSAGRSDTDAAQRQSGTAASMPLQLSEIRVLTVPDASAADSKLSNAPLSTTVYPRLGLGQLQRHASKGAQFVRFERGDSDEMQATSEWIIP